MLTTTSRQNPASNATDPYSSYSDEVLHFPQPAASLARPLESLNKEVASLGM